MRKEVVSKSMNEIIT